MSLDDLLRAIEDAAVLARYFKTGPGDHGEVADWRPLLTSPIHEHRLAAVVVMAERAGRGPRARPTFPPPRSAGADLTR